MSPVLSITFHASQVAAIARRRRAALQLAFGSAAVVLGFWGWSIAEHAKDWSGHLNNFFRTLQLITLHFPTAFDSAIPWQLQIARLMVPAIAVLATLDVLVGAITRPLRLAMMPHMRDHLLIVGDTKVADDALQALKKRGQHVVAVAASVDEAHRETLEALGITVVEANPAEPSTWQALSLARASALLIIGDDDLGNVDVAILALQTIDHRPVASRPLAVAVRIGNERLAQELDAALDKSARRMRIAYRRLSPDREGLRLALAGAAPVFVKPEAAAPSHVAVVGLAGQWQQTLMQLIVAAQDRPTDRPVLSLLLTDDEMVAFSSWRAQRPDLDLIARFDTADRGVERLPDEAAARAWIARCGPPHLFVVQVDDNASVATALAIRREAIQWDASRAPILVRREQKDRLLSMLGGTERGGAPVAPMQAFGGIVRLETVERLLDGKGEEVAQALHGKYRLNSPSAASAALSWDDLPENLREANRASAAHAPILVAALGLRIVPGGGPSAKLSEAELDAMARIEHRRWIADRIDRGWRHGAIRDDDRRLHPDIVDYDVLGDADRKKDRDAVLALLSALEDAGFSLAR